MMMYLPIRSQYVALQHWLQPFLYLRPLRAHGTRHNRDLLYRLRILLQGADQRMTNLMIRNNPALLLAQDAEG